MFKPFSNKLCLGVVLLSRPTMSSKPVSLILTLVLVNVLFSCSLFDPGSVQKSQKGSDNEPIIQIIELDVQKRTSSADWVYCEAVEVDIKKFFNVDSVVFGTLLRSQKSTEKAIVELYNFSLESSIQNSRLESNVRYILNYVETQNMLATFLEEPTLLGIRLKSSKEGHFVEVGAGSQILIYSH